MSKDKSSTSRVASVSGAVLVAMTVANAMVLVDQTAVPLILPSIMREMHVGSELAQWVMNASLLPLAGLLVLGGRLADLLGRRRVFIVGTAVFAAASALAGFSPTFGLLILFRVLQGVGGALMLPTSVAIVSSSYPGKDRGRALGLMGGAAAIAGALGPMIGGGLASTLGWRSVLLINTPLGILTIVITLIAVRPDGARQTAARIDMVGTALFSVALIGLVFGLSQSQVWAWQSPGVLAPLAVSFVAAILFVWHERRTPSPLLDFSLLRRHPNYLAATTSQGIAGMAEMGLGILFPLVLILQLGMTPALAGLALVPATIPMIIVAPLAGRWYDRVGGRPPLAVGFLVLALSGVVLSFGVRSHDYWFLFPGFLVYGIGLALVLTVNDPVSLDTVPDDDQGQASGVSATAEQFGGALGIAILYLVFHSVYVLTLVHMIAVNPTLSSLTTSQGDAMRRTLINAEGTGLNPSHVASWLQPYLTTAFRASSWGMAAAFLTVTLLSGIALAIVAILVRKPTDQRLTSTGEDAELRDLR